MSIAKVIERKNRLSEVSSKRIKTRESIVSMFREYVASKAEEITPFIPYVTVGEGYSGNIVGVSYSTSRSTLSGERNLIGSDTKNIVLSSTKLHFNIGYGANSASGQKTIPFTLEMTKPQLKRLFQQALELLVSMTYNEHSLKDYHIQQEISFTHKTHRQVLRKDLNSKLLREQAELFQAGGTHWYYKMNGALFVDAYGRDVYEFKK